MEQQPITSEANNQNSPVTAALPISNTAENSVLTCLRSQSPTKPILRASKIESSIQKKGEYVISYNFDHSQPGSYSTKTHNIFIGWDEEPTKKKPIKKLKSQQTPTPVHSRTPLRNHLAKINNIVSEEDLKQETESDSLSINELTKRIGSQIKDKYDSMFIQRGGSRKNKQCSIYHGKTVIKDERMPLIEKSRNKDAPVGLTTTKTSLNRNGSLQVLKPIPNPVLQTLRKSQNQCKQRQKETSKYSNEMVPLNLQSKENHNRIKLASVSSSKGKNMKAKDEVKVEEKLQYRNGRTIQHKQIPKITSRGALNQTKNQTKESPQKELKKAVEKQPKSSKQKVNKIFNTTDNLKGDKQKQVQNSQQESDQSFYGADTLKLIQELEKMQSNDNSPNKSKSVQKQEEFKQETSNVEKTDNPIGSKDPENLKPGAEQQTPVKKFHEQAVVQNQKQDIKISKNKNRQVKHAGIKKGFNQIPLGLDKKKEQKKDYENTQKHQEIRKLKVEPEKNKASLQNNGKVPKQKSVIQKKQEKKQPNVYIPKLDIKENNQLQLKHQKANKNSEVNDKDKPEEKVHEISHNQEKIKQEIQDKLSIKNQLEAKKTDVKQVNKAIEKGGSKNQNERKDRKQDGKQKKQLKKQVFKGNLKSPKMFNAVYLQQEQATCVGNDMQKANNKSEGIKKVEQTDTFKQKKEVDSLSPAIEKEGNSTGQEKFHGNKPAPKDDQARGHQNLRSPRQLGIKSNQINMKLSPRQNHQLGSPELPVKPAIELTKREESFPGMTGPNQINLKPKQNPQQIAFKQKEVPIVKQPNLQEQNQQSKQVLDKLKGENKISSIQLKQNQDKNQNCKSVRKEESEVEEKVIEAEENPSDKIKPDKQEKRAVIQNSSSAAIHRKKLDLKLMNNEGQERTGKKQEEPMNKSKQKQKLTQSSRSSKRQDAANKINTQGRNSALKQPVKNVAPKEQKKQLKAQENPRAINSQLEKTEKKSRQSDKKRSSNQPSKIDKAQRKSPRASLLNQGQKQKRSQYAESDSQLQTNSKAFDSQAPKEITCISKRSSPSLSSIPNNVESFGGIRQKAKSPEAKLIRVKELKNAAVQKSEEMQTGKKGTAMEKVDISVGTSAKQIKEKASSKKLMMDQQVQHSEEVKQNCRTAPEENDNVLGDDNIFSFANITCEPNIEKTQKQSFLDISNTDKLNQTDFLQSPKLIQRKLNNNSNVLASKSRVRDRSLFEHAPVLSFVYDEQKKLVDQQRAETEMKTSEPCLISTEHLIADTDQNCIISKALKIVAETDSWLVDRIIEPYLNERGENRIWLYCKGHWKCFTTNNIDVLSIFRDVITKALRKEYNQASPDEIGVQEIIRMLTGCRVMALRNKKKLSQELSYHLNKSYTIKGISSRPKKPIYSITAIETTAKMEKLIKIQIKENSSGQDEEQKEIDKDNSILWIKQELFEKYFDYFLLICYREQSWWTSKTLRKTEPTETLVYTIDSLTNSIGSLQLHSDYQLCCKIDLYREVKPKVLKFIGSVNQRNKPIRSTSNPNPSLSFNFSIKGRYYIMIRFSELPQRAPPLHLSLQSSKEIRLAYLETIQHETYRNTTSEYIEINAKATKKTINQLNKSRSTIKNRDNSIFEGKSKESIKEQFIKFLMEEKEQAK